MTTQCITLGTSSCRAWQRYAFYWNNVNFKAKKLHFKQSYDKQNLTLVVISYEMILYLNFDYDISSKDGHSECPMYFSIDFWAE